MGSTVGLPDGYGTGYVDAGTAVKLINSTNVTSVGVNAATGEISIAYTTVVAPAGENVLNLSPFTGTLAASIALTDAQAAFIPAPAEVQWKCNSVISVALGSGTAGTLEAKYAPAVCRE